MIISAEYLDIGKIAESGQCFRMTMNEDGSYSVIHKGKYLRISKADDGFSYEFDCSEDEYENVWKPYFDMDFDYANVEKNVDADDEFLVSAVRYGSGIRILNQDPWEMVVSFIISQRKSIPAIRTSIEKLCRLCGDEIHYNGEIYYSFPSAEKVAALSEEELLSCSVGYRAAYIKAAAEAVTSGNVDLDKLFLLDDEGLKEELLSMHGIGVKVASCIMLFGYHRLDSFPVDVWIERAMAEQYPSGFPYDIYEGYAGIMQQYIFFYMRYLHGRIE